MNGMGGGGDRLRGGWHGWRRAVWPSVELAVGLGVALAFAKFADTVRIDPLDRLGQVAGLAVLQFRFAACGILLLALTYFAGQARRPESRYRMERLTAAALAGLATGLVGGAIAVALHGTCNPLFYPAAGDTARIVQWATGAQGGGRPPAGYPPLFIHLLARYAQLTSQSVAHAYRDAQVLGLAAFGPLAYGAWRLFFPPLTATAVAVTTALPLLEPYKPYPNLVLVVLVPVFAAFLRALSGAAAGPWRGSAVAGLGFGAAFGTLFVTYSGWFWWCAAGAAVALVWHWPRHRAGRALPFAGATLAAFLVIAGPLVIDTLKAGNAAKDLYIYFDVLAPPAYVAMWRGDMPGNPGPWPPPGELGGVGLFTLLMAAGTAFGLMAGARIKALRPVVATAGFCLASAWLMRFWFAGHLYSTGSPQLYPRTTMVILHCLLLLSAVGGVALYRLVKTRRELLEPRLAAGDPAVRPAVTVKMGALVAMLIVYASAGDAIGDRYMPRDDDSVAQFAWTTHAGAAEDKDCAAREGRGASQSGEAREKTGP